MSNIAEQPPFFNSPKVALAFVLLVAAALRVLSVFALHHYLRPTTWEFGELAHRIVKGQGYTDLLASGSVVPSAYMPPFYTYLLAIVWRIFGESAATYLGIELVQAALGVLLVFVVYRIAALLFSINIALTAAIMTAVWPSFIYLCNEFHSISVYVLFGLSAVYFLARYIEYSRSLKDIIYLGLSMGVVLLCRAEAVALVFLYAGILLCRCGRKALPHAVAAALISFACLMPWTVRNTRAFGHLVLITTSGGSNLFIGHNPRATGNGDAGPDYLTPEQKALVERVSGPRDTEVKLDRLQRSWAIEFARLHPASELHLAARKLFLFFVFDPGHKKGRNLLYWGPSLVLMLLAAWGAWLRRRHLLQRDLPLTATIFFGISVAVLVFVLPRYRIAIDPLLVLFAAHAVEKIFQHRRKRVPLRRDWRNA